MLIALRVEIELCFALRSTVSEIMAIEVSTLAAILDFSKNLKSPKGHFGEFVIVLRVEIELRFALRSTVSEITSIEVSTLAAMLDFSKHLKTTKMAF